MLHTLYTNAGRTACFRQLGRQCEPGSLRVLAHFGQGHYQVSDARGTNIATAFNFHPMEGGLEARTNLYYAESADGGATWSGPSGQALNLPLREVQNTALLREYASDGWLVYLKDMKLDAAGNPAILFVRSRGHRPGPKSGPRIWTLARRSPPGDWYFADITTSDSNYDMGSLFQVDGGSWSLLAPTGEGPQPGNPGGEVVLWESDKLGLKWECRRALTNGSRHNHTYVRRTRGATGQFAAFWADGNPREPSESSLYISDSEFRGVWRLPPKMSAGHEMPQMVSYVER